MPNNVVAIHQPNFIPWLGYFYKIAQCDVFVLLDNVDFQQGNKNSITSRTKIKCNNEEKYLLVSVKNNKESKLIKDIKIDKITTKVSKLLKTIQYNYSKANYYNVIYPLIENIFLKYIEFDNLSDANTFAISQICNILNIKASIIKSSSLNLQNNLRNERIIEICNVLNSQFYYSGQGAKVYHDELLFKQNGVTIIYSDFKPNEYTQVGNNFLPGLSILDTLLNVGVVGTKQILQI